MKYLISVILLIVLPFLMGCQTKKASIETSKQVLVGTWVKVGPRGVVSMQLDGNGLFELDMHRDGNIDIYGEYKIEGDTIVFVDKKGMACPASGVYRLYRTEYYISFDLIEDDCGGRIKNTMGFWVSKDFKKQMKELDKKIEGDPNVELLLSRARMNMALGKSFEAKKDFLVYLENGKVDDRIYINLAGTCFPDDLETAINYCDKAITLNPEAKNAYFLRGLARYMTGLEKEACDDFGTAIALGFSVLKIAEHERCAEYWE